MGRVLALGVAGSSAGVEATVAGLTAGAGLLLSSGGLAAKGTNSITLEDVAARLTLGAAGAEAGDGWEDWQIRGATETREGNEDRVGSLHRLGVRVG